MRKITAMVVRTIKKPGRYRADDTLYLYVQRPGGGSGSSASVSTGGAST